jgi:hypothetical protein
MGNNGKAVEPLAQVVAILMPDGNVVINFGAQSADVLRQYGRRPRGMVLEMLEEAKLLAPQLIAQWEQQQQQGVVPAPPDFKIPRA